jgi:hypothetical protein
MSDVCGASCTFESCIPIFIQYHWHSIPTVQVGQHQTPLKQVAHIQNGRLLPTQRRLLPIPAYLQRDIVGHAVGAESGSLLTLWCWVSPANSSSSRAHENKNRADFPLSPLVYFCFSLSLLVYFVFHYLPWCIFAFHYLSW